MTTEQDNVRLEADRDAQRHALEAELCDLKIKKSRGKAGFTRIKNRLYDLCQDEEITKQEIQHTLDKLESAMDKYIENINEIVSFLRNAGRTDEMIQALTEVERAESQYEEVLVAYRETQTDISSKGSKNNDNNHSTQEDNQDKKGKDLWRQLQRVSIPVFSCEKRKYESWKAAFTACVDNAPATPEYKLLQLRQYLRGDALNCIEELGHSADAYISAKERLDRKFGGERRQIMRFLENLESFSPLKNENAREIERFADLLDLAVLKLKELEHREDLADGSLYVRMMKKLPQTMLIRYNRWIFESKETESLHTLRRWVILEAEFAVAANETIYGLASPSSASSGGDRYHKNNNRSFYGRHNSMSNSHSSKCLVCDNAHNVSECKQFESLTCSEKWNTAKQLNLCFRCLGTTHRAKSCRQSKICGINSCKQNHHKLLHNPAKDYIEQSKHVDSTLNPEAPVFQSHEITTHSSSSEYVALRTVPVILRNGNRSVKINALLDDGSTKTYLNENVAAELGLQGEMKTMTVKVLNDTVETFSTMSVKVGLESLDRKVKREIEIQTVKNVTGSLKVIDWKNEGKRYKHLAEIEFPTVARKPKIDMLIGIDNADLHTSNREICGKIGEPVARLTPFGWTCVGIVSNSCNETSYPTFFVSEISEVNNMMKRFWEIENVDDGVRSLSPEDRLVIEQTENSLEVSSNFYRVSLPWKDSKEQLKNNYSVAVNRLRNTEKRLHRDELLLSKYNKIIEQYVEKGYVNKISDSETESSGWYLPHFPIVKPEKETTKIRIVFDASAKYDGLSLNDSVYQGPKLQQELFNVLLRFRRHPIALMCDVAEMYLRIGIDPKDQKYHRFLWRTSPDKPIETYEFNRLVFGVNVSPFLAQYVSQHNAVKNQVIYPLAAETVQKSTYMDDGMDSVETSEIGIELYEQLKGLWSKAGMHVRKWLSNSSVVLEQIPQQDRATQVDLSKCELPTVKTLGMWWQASEDNFSFQLNIPSDKLKLTKRNFLKTIASVFDPLGFIAPFVVRAKVIMQNIWISGIEWDDTVSPDIEGQIKKWFQELEELKNLQIPRCLRHENCDSKVESLTLHTCVDASTLAYGAVTYVRCTYETGDTTVRIVAAKVKIAPMESTSIPRLELLGAMVGLKLTLAICRALEIDIELATFWCDNLNVLYWIRNQSRQYKPFVANRIGEIHRATNPSQWRYIPTKENPADCVSRGTSVANLDSESTNWWQGPEFLKEDETEWPKNRVEMSADAQKEVKQAKHANYNVIQGTVTEISWRLHPERYSCWIRLVHVHAWVSRFIENCRVEKENRVKGPLQVHEIQDTEMKIVSEAQRESFAEDYDRLCKSKPLLKSSKLLKLNPKLDNESVMRCDGRLKYVEYISYDTRYPIILSRNCAVTKLIVKHFHEKTNHSGTNQTLSELSSRYWIIAAREEIRNCETNCMECRRRKLKPGKQIMAPLPNIRVNMPLRAFAHTAVDYAGPFLTKQGRGKHREKRYLCLFTCLASRAVHLEVAFGLDTSAFLNAFYRMTNRRGLPVKILSDNGTNFVGGNRELKDLVKQLSNYQDAIVENTANKGIEWQFNPPLAPHWGGVHETMIKTAKRAIYAILQNADINDEELITAFTGAENLINSRPLTYQSANPADCTPITPNHFLFGLVGGQFAPQSVDETRYNPIKRWRRVQELVSHFWQRWLREWLPGLNSRKKWQTESKDMKVGDIVIVIMPDIPRGQWPLGRVTKTHPGKDGHVRAATVLVGKKEMTRPIVKLCTLELDVDSQKCNNNESSR